MAGAGLPPVPPAFLLTALPKALPTDDNAAPQDGAFRLPMRWAVKDSNLQP
jgi:hypothetical protein